MTTKPTIIISIDVEATGDSPATASCVMIGAVAVIDDVNPDTTDYVVGKLRLCIEEQPNRKNDERCMTEFWSKNQELWAYIKANQIPVRDVMKQFVDWYSGLLVKYNCRTFLMKPASYDWQWVNCLYDEYGPVGKPKLPFSHRCLTSMQVEFAYASKMDIKEIRELTVCHDVMHTHYSDDDAHEQAYCYLKLIWLTKQTTTVDVEKFKKLAVV